jgi:Bax protein
MIVNHIFKTLLMFIIVAILLFQTFYIIELKKNNNQLKRITIVEEKVIEVERNSSKIKQREVAKNKDDKNTTLKKYLKYQIDFSTLRKKYHDNSMLEKDSFDISQMTLKKKKEYFISIVLPPILESRDKLLITYKNVLKIRNRALTIEDEEYLTILYNRYNIKRDDFNSLLKAIKPHPASLILAQAIISSGWGQSRFFLEGNNIFALVSLNENEDRMKVKNGNTHMKKYDSIVESVDDYMLLLGRSEQYSDFRNMRTYVNNPLELSKYLTSFSTDQEYSKKIQQTINFNKLTKYDKKEDDKDLKID